MDYYPFPARLRAEYNDICEYGQATVAPADGALDFTGDFVPLLPLGARAVVEWIFGDRIIAPFEGEVYLSSPGLLRLLKVDEEMLVQMRAVFAQNTPGLPASVWALHKGMPQRPSSVAPATIISLSTDYVTLVTPAYYEEGARLVLDAEVDFLTLSDFTLHVFRPVGLRRNENLILCRVIDHNQANTIALSAYTARLEHPDRSGMA